MHAVTAPSTAPARFHPRVAANLMVTVQTGRRSLIAKARDLSMDGLFLRDMPELRERVVTVSIPLGRDVEVTTACTVTRSQNEGIALRFIELDWDDLIALARYLHPRLP